MRIITTKNTYNGHPLNKSWKNNYGFYEELLRIIEKQFYDMISRHSKVLFVRFDLRFPAGSAYPNDNELVSRFIESFRLQCKRSGYDPQYIWVRELSKETGQVHYHFALLLNGNKIQHPYFLITDYATKLWQKQLGIENGAGLVEFVKDIPNCGIIMRNDPNLSQVVNACFERASYLAKVYSKEETPASVNRFRCSRLPHYQN